MDTSSTTTVLTLPQDRNIRVVSRAELAQMLREKGNIRFGLSPYSGLRTVEIPPVEESLAIARRLRDF
jgi:hypothetical protein